MVQGTARPPQCRHPWCVPPICARGAINFGLPPQFTSSAVNNAGSAHGLDHVGNILDSDIDAMFATNVLGLISVTQLLVKGASYSLRKLPARAQLTHVYLTDFKARNTGHVINIGSLAGRESYSGGSVYCATKAAVRAFTGSLLREVVNTPIRVTEIQPGPVLLPPLLPLLTLHYAP